VGQTPTSLGFLTVLHEASGYLGGYLVTNFWGRPLEFRLSSAVQPNRVQQILYGGTLQSYLHAELIGKTLVEKAAMPVQLIITDREPVLDLRQSLETPVVWLAPPDDVLTAAPADGGRVALPAREGRGPVLCHARFPRDVAVVRELLTSVDGTLDLGEPFVRIRDAIAEARKMGVGSR
jgi:hypothetical protein